MARKRSRITGKGALKVLGAFAAAGAVLVVLGWLAFVPRTAGPGYAFVATWGSAGDGPGQFSDPTGIVVAGDEVFVSDSRNGRIQVFGLDGAFRRAFGATPGGGLGRPMNLTVAGAELYVADYWNDTVEVFALDGAHRRSIGGKGDGPGELRSPGGVAVARNGDLVVADFYNQRLQRLRADGGFVRQWGETGEYSIGAGGFGYPTDVAFGPDGSLYVADGYNDRVQAFAPDGSFSHKWGGPFATNIWGPFNGWFATVTSIAVDAEGNILVADFYNHRVQKFTPDGAFLSAFGGKGDGPGEFNFVSAAAPAPDGSIYVADFANNRIQLWRPRSDR